MFPIVYQYVMLPQMLRWLFRIQIFFGQGLTQVVAGKNLIYFFGMRSVFCVLWAEAEKANPFCDKNTLTVE